MGMTSVLYPDQQTYGDTWQQGTICRPTPIGGCIQFMHYDRYLSNRLRKYGPFDRIIDVARLKGIVTLDDVYGPERSAIVLKVPLMGVVIERRRSFQDQIYPDKGMECGTVATA